MNDDIKKGAKQLAEGLKTEAKDLAVEAKSKFEQVKKALDKDADGKVELNEVKDNLFDETKK